MVYAEDVELWSEWIRGHWQIESAGHYICDVAHLECENSPERMRSAISGENPQRLKLLKEICAASSKSWTVSGDCVFRI